MCKPKKSISIFQIEKIEAKDMLGKENDIADIQRYHVGNCSLLEL